jgi:hypothetical protein
VKSIIAVAGISAFTFAAVSASAEVPPPENVIVFKEAGRFGGWPANHGIWSWGDEIVVGFEDGAFKKDAVGHLIDPDKPSIPSLARSLDGGKTWKIEKPEVFTSTAKPEPCPGDIDFTHPDFAMTLRMTHFKRGLSKFYISYDRAKTWKGPYQLPSFDQKWIAARTDYIANGKSDCTIFATAAKSNSSEGRAFSARTQDGGKTWQSFAWMTPEYPGQNSTGFTIMPSSVRLDPKTIVSAVRSRNQDKAWLPLYVSEDDGATWSFRSDIATDLGGASNPGGLIMLKDGRLCATYGCRKPPYGIRARISADGGKTWGDEIMLRKDGGCWDLGYVRTVQRPDAKIVTVYYFNDKPDAERYIAATIWSPPAP